MNTTPEPMTTTPEPTKRVPPPQPTSEEALAMLDTMLERYSWGSVIRTIAIGIALGLVIAWLVIPVYVMSTVNTLFGDAPKAYWYLSRSSGVIAYVLLWLSVVWGLLLTTAIGKTLGKVAAIVDLHRHISWLTVVFGLVHAIILLGDRYITYTVWTLFVPYADTTYRPDAVALGQIGFYVLTFVTVSFWARRWTGQKVWRGIHYLSFGVYIVIALHAIWAGTDADTLYWVYVGTGISVLFLVVLRLLNWVIERRDQPAGVAPETT